MRFYVRQCIASRSAARAPAGADTAGGASVSAAAQGAVDPVLEIGCGSGRITLPLLRRGIPVVGVDLSLPMLGRCAERLAWAGRRAKAPAHLARADMRALPLATSRFERIVCPFNTFMHLYHPPDISACLREVRRLLAPGTGRFLFDVLNPDLRWLTRNPRKRWARTPFKHPVSGQRYVYTTNHLYDARRQICFITLYYDCLDDPARSQRVLVAHRHFFPQELRALLRHHGFEVTREWGDFEGGPFEGDSIQQILECRRVD